MQTTTLTSACALAVFVVCLPAPALAQEPGQAKTAAAQNHGDPTTRFLELGVHYGAPERLSGSLTGVFFYRQPTPRRGQALVLRAAAGQGGFSAGIGHRWGLYGPFGPEASMTVSRTFSSPRGSTGHSTYVGLEVGYVSLGRFSIGVARQVDGPSDRRDTILTGSIGVQIPRGLWREIWNGL
ncbi:MAG TPA: hypothetical protein VKE51_32525 [Vicinamibacterales bacterium]|nr:hypothetical protein [Vicinamibacterales bacterium]